MSRCRGSFRLCLSLGGMMSGIRELRTFCFERSERGCCRGAPRVNEKSAGNSRQEHGRGWSVCSLPHDRPPWHRWPFGTSLKLGRGVTRACHAFGCSFRSHSVSEVTQQGLRSRRSVAIQPCLSSCVMMFSDCAFPAIRSAWLWAA